MELPYKLHLGASCILRADFLRNLHAAREQRPPCSPETGGKVWVAQLLSSTVSAPPPAHLAAHRPPSKPLSKPRPELMELEHELEPPARLGLAPPRREAFPVDPRADPPVAPTPSCTPALAVSDPTHRGGTTPSPTADTRPLVPKTHKEAVLKVVPVPLRAAAALPGALPPKRPGHCWAEAHLTPALAAGA